jgi:hypothetical protein
MGGPRADPSQTFVSVSVSPKLFNPLGASNAPDLKNDVFNRIYVVTLPQFQTKDV